MSATPAPRPSPPGSLWVFSGQGPTPVGLGAGLMTAPAFLEAITALDERFSARAGWSLVGSLRAGVSEAEWGDPARSIPLHAAWQLGLTALLVGLGRRPAAALGHSVGEYAALACAGVLSAADALELARVAGAEIAGRCPPGLSLAVHLEGELAPVLAPWAGRVWLAGVNGPADWVVSGEVRAVEEVEALLRARGARVRRLSMPCAVHSPLLEPMVEPVEALLRALPLRPPTLPYLSATAGGGLGADALRPEALARTQTRPLRLDAALQAAEASEVLELSPLPLLSAVLQAALPAARVVCAGRRDLPELVGVLEAVAALGGAPPEASAAGGSARAAVAQALRLPAAELPLDRPLVALGLDSIGALELVRVLHARWGCALSVWALLDGMTAGALLAQVEAAGAAPAPGGEGTIQPDRASRGAPFPLTPIQETYLVGRAGGYGVGGVSCHGYLEIDLDPALEVGALERSWRLLIERHDMLRTVILPHEGQQRVLQEVPPYAIHTADLRGQDPAGVLAAWREALEAEVRPVDVWPLFELRAARTDAGWRLFISFDLIVGDAASWFALFREWETALQAPERLPPVPEVRFRDYLLAERRALAGERAQADRRWWEDRMAALPPGPELPLVQDPSALERPRFVRHSGGLGAADWEALRAAAVGRGLTPSTVLAAAFAEVLAAWGRSRALTLNLTLFQRLPLHPDLDRVYGEFTSNLLLPLAGQGASFAERAAAAQRALMQGLEHTSVSGVELLRSLARRQGVSPTGIAPVVFTSLLGHDTETLPWGWLGQERYAVSQTPQLILDFQLQNRAGGLAYNWDMVDALFPEGLPERLLRAYTALLERLAREPGTWAAPTLGLAPPEELAQIAQTNRTEAPWTPRALHAGFVAQAQAQPGQVALRWEGGALGYGALEERSRVLAVALRAAGLEPGALVAILLPRGPDAIAAVLGVWRAGGVVVAVSADWPAQRVARVLDDADVGWIVGEAGEAARGRRVLAVPEEGPAEAAELPAVDPAQLAYILYTSGSTGRPKGVAVTHAAAWNTVEDLNHRVGLGPTDAVFGISNLSFDLSIWDIAGTLAAGATLVLAPEGRDPGRWDAGVREAGVSVWSSVPALFEMLVEHAEQSGAGLPPSLRQVMLSGDWIPVRLPARAWALAPALHLLSLGGATEASIWSIAWPITAVDPTWASIPYGRPLRNQRFYVLDEALEHRPVHAVGQLYIGGVGLAEGYWRDPERTAAAFITHPHTGERLYRTGDLGRWRPDGAIEFLGREDGQVKILGFRVELGEVESALRQLPGVAEAVAAARGPRERRRLVAWVVPADPAQPPDPAALREALALALPPYMVPPALGLVERLPLTPNGKVDRAALPEPDAAQAADLPPAGPLEALIAGQWAALLERPVASARRTLFELGGDSILAIRAVGALGAALGVEVPLARFLQDPTVAGLAARVQEALPTPPAPELLAAAAERLSATGRAVRVQPDPERALEPFPLNEVQEAYWVGRNEGFELGGVSAAMYWEFDCVQLEPAQLTRALQDLVDRHPMLRAVVRPDGRQQVLHPPPQVQLPVWDLRGRPEDEVQARLAEVRDRLQHRQADPAVWPLFVAEVCQLGGGGRCRLHLSFDLLFTDGWSVFKVLHAWGRRARDPYAPLPSPTLGFRDYVLYTLAQQEGPAYARHLDWWRGRLDGLPPAPELPTQRAAAGLRHHRFEHREAQLPPERWQALVAQARAHGLTPAVVITAAWSAVLARWSRRPHFCLNMTLFDREPVHPEVDEVIGDFTTLLPLEVDLRRPGRFLDLARAVSARLFEDLDHRAVGGVRVLREWSARAGAAAARLPVVLTCGVGLNPNQDNAGPGHALGRRVYAMTQTPQVELDHQTWVEDGALAVCWDAVAGLHAPGVLDAAFAAYMALLTALSGDAGAWEAEATVPLPPEQLARRVAYNHTAAPVAEHTLHSLFLERAALQPEAVALRQGEERWTYGALRQRALALAGALRARGAGAGELVAVLLPKGPEQALATLAVMLCGAAWLPIDPGLPEARRAALLGDGGCRFALAGPALTLPAEVQRVDLAEQGAAALPAVNASALAYVLYTSGSTGQPKGVMIAHRAAVNTVLDINERFGVGPQDRVLALSALSFDLSVWDLFGVLAAGGEVVFPEADQGRDPAAWCTLAREQGVTLWNSVPTLLAMLVERLEQGEPAAGLGLRTALLSGDWIPVDLPARLARVLPQAELVSLGGATEAAIWSIVWRGGALPGWTSLPYGQPLRNQTVHVLDPRLQPCPEGVTGELFIGGLGVAEGYWRDPARTAERFVRHPQTGERLYRTGDLGRFHPEGLVEFLGREDAQVKVSGYRVELGELEAAALAHPGVAAAAAFAVGEPRGDRRLGLAWVAGGPGAPQEALRQHLAARLPGYMVPAVWLPLDALPLSANGKVDRGALAQRAAQAPAPAARVVASEGLRERVVAEATAVLERPLDPARRLLEQGANSVDLIQLVGRLERAFGFRPEMEVFFRLETLDGIARWYAEAQGAPAGEAPAAAQQPWEALPMILEPEARDRFKASRPGRPDYGPGHPGPALPRGPVSELARRRRSLRRYALEPVGLGALGGLLSALATTPGSPLPTTCYGSAGPTWPVRALVQAWRVEGLAGGLYGYEPDAHRLALLAEGPVVHGGLALPAARGMVDDAAFAVLLLARMDAIAPLYGARALPFALLEAGAVCQLLESEATAHGLGLCQVGGLDFEPVAERLGLDPLTVYLHGLVGGAPRWEEDEI